MPSPELRCLECNRQFADLTADHDVERCGDCGKFVVASQTVATKAAPPPPEIVTADFANDDDNIPTVGKAKPADDLPLAQPVRPAAPAITLPAWAKRDSDEPAEPRRAEPPRAEPAKRPDPFRPSLPPRPAAQPTRAEPQFADDPPVEVKRPRIGFALFIAFLFFVAMAAAVGVLGYTIIRGLQMKKVITEVRPAALSRANGS